MIDQIKKLSEGISKKILYTKEFIVDYSTWIYYDAFSWKAIEWYKIDKINKQLIQFAWSLVSVIIGFFILCYLFWGTDIIQSNKIFVIIFVILFSLLLFIACVLGKRMKELELELYVKSCLTIFQFPEFQSNTEHSAIILIHYEKIETEEGIFDLSTLLINGFRENKIPYKVYHVFEPSDFESIFYNNLVKDLWIIGHGDHGGFSYGKKRREIDYFSYSKLKKMPAKRFIAQLHCNGGNKESLVSINHPDEGYVTTRIQTLSQIRYFIISKMNELNK